MYKNISSLISIGLVALIFTFATAQDKKSANTSRPAQSPSQELLMAWNASGSKLIDMAEDFPEDKYGFKAQKDQRTFGENLLHIAYVDNIMIGAINGSGERFAWNEDSLKNKYATKAEIVKYLKQAVTDGAELIKAQGDSGLTREFKYPWGNMMVHGSFGWMGVIEHSGEHYGQLVVYYRVSGMVPPASRPRK